MRSSEVYYPIKHTLFKSHRRFYAEYKLQDDEHQVLTDKLRFIVLDLTAVDEASDSDKAHGLVQWAQAFNARDWNTVESIDRAGVKEAANTMKGIMANPTDRMLLWDRHLAIMDRNTEIIDATQKGIAEGHKLGDEAASRRFILGMKAKGIDDGTIADISGLSLDEIRKF